MARRSGGEGSVRPSVGVLLQVCTLTGDQSAVPLEKEFGVLDNPAMG